MSDQYRDWNEPFQPHDPADWDAHNPLGPSSQAIMRGDAPHLYPQETREYPEHRPDYLTALLMLGGAATHPGLDPQARQSAQSILANDPGLQHITQPEFGSFELHNPLTGEGTGRNVYPLAPFAASESVLANVINQASRLGGKEPPLYNPEITLDEAWHNVGAADVDASIAAFFSGLFADPLDKVGKGVQWAGIGAYQVGRLAKRVNKALGNAIDARRAARVAGGAPAGAQGALDDLFNSYGGRVMRAPNGFAVVDSNQGSLYVTIRHDPATGHYFYVESLQQGPGATPGAGIFSDATAFAEVADVNGVLLVTYPSASGAQQLTTEQLRHMYNNLNFEYSGGGLMVRMPTDVTNQAARAAEGALRAQSKLEMDAWMALTNRMGMYNNPRSLPMVRDPNTNALVPGVYRVNPTGEGIDYVTQHGNILPMDLLYTTGDRFADGVAEAWDVLRRHESVTGESPMVFMKKIANSRDNSAATFMQAGLPQSEAQRMADAIGNAGSPGAWQLDSPLSGDVARLVSAEQNASMAARQAAAGATPQAPPSPAPQPAPAPTPQPPASGAVGAAAQPPASPAPQPPASPAPQPPASPAPQPQQPAPPTAQQLGPAGAVASTEQARMVGALAGHYGSEADLLSNIATDLNGVLANAQQVAPGMSARDVFDGLEMFIADLEASGRLGRRSAVVARGRVIAGRQAAAGVTPTGATPVMSHLLGIFGTDDAIAYALLASPRQVIAEALGVNSDALRVMRQLERHVDGARANGLISPPEAAQMVTNVRRVMLGFPTP